MTASEQTLIRSTCHELRTIRATLQAGFRHIQNPNVPSEKLRPLCDQAFERLDQLLEKLESQIVERSEEEI